MFAKSSVKLSSGDIEPCQYAQKIITALGLACKFRSGKEANCFDVFAGADKKHNNFLRAELRKLGLWNKLGYEKFIPDIYKLGSRKVRPAILAGLIDSDGTLSENNSMSYCTTSKQLAKDVAFVAGSLGFGVSLRKPQIWPNEK